jgi:hypothetical protein
MQFDKQFHGGRSPVVLTGAARRFFGSGNGQWCASRNPAGIHFPMCSTGRHQSASMGSANT